jgi:hypothetical protein
MPVIPMYGYYLPYDKLAVPLERYAQIMGCPEPAFFGINWIGNATYHCPTIWTQDQRLAIAHALTEAQRDIELKIGYDLVPTYHTEERHLCTRYSVRTLYAYLIAFGTKDTINLELNAVLDHTNDPSIVVSIDITGLTVLEEEVHVYHPGTDIEIYPSEISVLGTNLNISIPRARLVKNDNNPDIGWDYTNLSNFETNVDVIQEYMDPDTAVNLVRRSTQSLSNCDPEILEAGCVRIDNKTNGLIRVSSFTEHSYRFFDLNYKAGLSSINSKLERAIVRFANSKLNIEPVDNAYIKTIWLADRDIPSNVSEENQNCPWGLSVGAWEAWILSKELTIHRAGSL